MASTHFIPKTLRLNIVITSLVKCFSLVSVKYFFGKWGKIVVYFVLFCTGQLQKKMLIFFCSFNIIPGLKNILEISSKIRGYTQISLKFAE